MRVVVNGWFWGQVATGSGQYTRRLAEALALNHPQLEIVVVVPSGTETGAGQALGNLRFVSLAERARAAGPLAKVWFEQVSFPRMCVRLGADVAHVPYWASPLWDSVPTLVTIHDLIPLVLAEYRGGPLVRLYTWLVSQSARRAHTVLTDSEASQRDIALHLHRPDAQVIPLAAEARYTPIAAPDDVAVRKRYGLPDRYWLYLGGFDVRKNLGVAMAAYCWASRTANAACPLVIAGRLPAQDTPFAPDPRRLAREQGLPPEAVRFLGAVADAEKPALYRGALAFLFPSRYEGFGLPPLEALACGTPVVASAASAIPEVVGDAGALLPPDDAEGMGAALARLATDPDHRADLSQRAADRAAMFSWERTACETLAVYQGALAQASGTE